ncbi:MAG: hypothetical protein FWG51_03845, partial [Firmicutes bacterium]|nr:hypothetical protein [Bacillota bacterium]
MKGENTLRLLFLIPCFLTASSLRGQDTTICKYAVYDTMNLPYVTASSISFSDSLETALKNNLANVLEKNNVAANAHAPFFMTGQSKVAQSPNRSMPQMDWAFA